MPFEKELRDLYNKHKRALKKAEKGYEEKKVLKARKVGTDEWTHTYNNAAHASKDEKIGLSESTIGRIINGKTKNKKWEFKREVIRIEFKYNKTWDDILRENGIVKKCEVEKPLRIEHEFIDGVECKWCGKCKKLKPLEDFSPSIIFWDNRKFSCNLCYEMDEYEPEDEEETQEDEFVITSLNRTPKQERLYQAWIRAKQDYAEKFNNWCQTKDHTVEVYVPIMKCPGYFVSNWGNLISYRKNTNGKQIGRAHV